MAVLRHYVLQAIKYATLGGADASVIALAERHSGTQIATLDHRHFTVVRPAHCAAFTLLP